MPSPSFADAAQVGAEGRELAMAAPVPGGRSPDSDRRERFGFSSPSTEGDDDETAEDGLGKWDEVALAGKRMALDTVVLPTESISMLLFALDRLDRGSLSDHEVRACLLSTSDDPRQSGFGPSKSFDPSVLLTPLRLFFSGLPPARNDSRRLTLPSGSS